MKYKILVVDNEQRMCLLIKEALELEDYEVEMAFSGNDAISKINAVKYDIVVTDLKMKPVDGLQVLKSVKENHPKTDVILITAFASQETALEAMKAGAYDYLIKPFKMDELLLRVERIEKQKKLEEENERLKGQQKPPDILEGIVGKSARMRHIFDLIKRVASSDATVLVLGESGTGKELVAKAVHAESNRRDKPFIAINCAALPETLLESELFGYEKGAFTGASQRKEGMFEVADGGSLFLDEIGDLSLGLQAKLLRVLQNKEIIRLGGREATRINVRLITATHHDLEGMISKQKFRSDLFYRINLFPINLPPLRERKEDIPELIEHFMKQFPEKQMATTAKIKLMEYNYPGNVRELENIISRAVIISESVIEDMQLPRTQSTIDSGEKSEIPFGVLPDSGVNIDDLVKDFILQAIAKTEGNKTKAAELLGITRRRLYSMMETYNIEL